MVCRRESYRVRPASRGDLHLIPALERAATKRYGGAGIAKVYDSLCMTAEQIEGRQHRGRLWVAVDRDERPVGFATWSVLDGLAHLDEIDPIAERIGAVNTILVAADGTLEGSNSDGFGFLENLRQAAPQWRAELGPVVLLGAGGSARAAAAALVDAGVPALRLVNRTIARAEQLAQDIGGPIEPYAWAQCGAALKDSALLVNSTTQGMKGQPALEIDVQPLPPTAIVYDIVYVPLETPLLAAARARGLATVDGLGMLLHQARPGFAAWFGVEPQVTPELRSFILADLAS